MFMKTNKNLYLFAAALVAGTMGMTSCSNEEITPNNPTFDGESVKTQFAINIPAAGNTRMTGENTQQPGTGGTTSFKGMHDIYLIPLTEEGKATSTFTNVIPLSEITTELEGTGKNYKLYNDVNIPVGTTNFLFYGMGQSDDPATVDDKFAEGILNNASLPAATKTTDIKFNLEAILSGDDFSNGMNAIVGVLNDVANAQNWSTQTDNTLEKLYEEYTKLKAGYASAVLTTMTELYNAADQIATSGSGAEQTVAGAIKTKIEASFDKNTPTGDDPYTLTWKSSVGVNDQFPTNLNVPEGAAQVSWSDGTGFAAATELIGTPDKVLDVKKLCYPASLAYFVNTPLKATNDGNFKDWPTTTADWTTGTAFTGWGTEVTAATQTVALQNNIQYSVANLKTSVKCKSATLEDNAQATGGLSANQMITVPGTGFEITGILIGGQPDQVDWQMKSTSANFDQTVYDRNVVSMYAKNGVYSDPNYTLVLENTANTTNKKVNIALELKNTTGIDFYGVDGKITKDMKFYLVAQLDPENVGAEGNKNGLEYVFNQDYVTDAKLTIASLKNAYVTIPDLRAAGFQLGLSVDLTWKDGIVFDVEIQ